MKKLTKSLMMLTSLGLAGLALASCGEDKRNTVTPYGSLNMDEVVATATNSYEGGSELQMTMKQYYSRLRYSANSVVNNKIKKAVYQKEYDAILDVIKHEELNEVSDATKTLLTLTKDGKSLYNLNDNDLDYNQEFKNNYQYIRSLIVNNISSELSVSIYSKSSYDSLKSVEEKDITTYKTKYIETKKRQGLTVTAQDLEFTKPTVESSDTPVFPKLTTTLLESGVLESSLLTQAEKLAAKNELYQIADEEYIVDYDAEDDTETKNSNYLFEKDATDKIAKSFDSSYKNFGTYHAIVIQFNSRRDAMETIEKLNLNFSNSVSALQSYVKLYNEVYSYLGDPVTEVYEDERFQYTSNAKKDDFSDVTSDIKELITSTLSDKEYLAEPRNLSNKYVMVYNLGTSYEVGNSDEPVDFEDLSAEDQALYTKRIKYNLIEANASSYTSTVYNKNIYTRTNNDDDSDDLLIFDPYAEYKYENSYSTIYELIGSKTYSSKNADNNLIFSLGDYQYTVADFLADATKEYGNTIISNYFQLEYTYQYYDTYIDSSLISSDTHDSNVETLEDAIKEFKKGNNTTYPKEMGEETYLLCAYGYSNKDDIIKYYYDAQSTLDTYKSVKVYESWATPNATDSSINDISDTAKNGFLKNLLETGNKTYADMFNINVDHFLINLDANGDGSPDDPTEYLANHEDDPDFKTKFENSVVALAQAIYTEAVSGKYGEDNSLYQILSFIKTRYEEGAPLLSEDYAGKTWDDFKDYAFLLTVEQLASSGDITQSSVSNFVKPFADYVKGIYKTISAQDVDMDDYENGVFYLYNRTDETGKVITSTTEKDQITLDTLCPTSFGYHVLVVNDYDGPSSTKFSKPTDTDDYQGKLKILIKEDKDDSNNNVVVTTNSYNEESNQASFNQFFIWYVQKATGATSSLDSDINTIMEALFSSAYSTYTSSNFQNYLLLDSLNIDYKMDNLKVFKDADKNYYANQITSYGESTNYTSWFDGTYKWDRPTK